MLEASDFEEDDFDSSLGDDSVRREIRLMNRASEHDADTKEFPEGLDPIALVQKLNHSFNQGLGGGQISLVQNMEDVRACGADEPEQEALAIPGMNLIVNAIDITIFQKSQRELFDQLKAREAQTAVGEEVQRQMTPGDLDKT